MTDIIGKKKSTLRTYFDRTPFLMNKEFPHLAIARHKTDRPPNENTLLCLIKCLPKSWAK